MAVDYGDVRTGIALSDLTCTLVGRAETLTLKGDALIAKICDIAAQEKATVVVVGLPRNMDGSYGFRAQITQEFADKLTAAGLNVVMRDERLTTVSAQTILSADNRSSSRQKRHAAPKGKVDAVAAGLILQEYLDFIANTR